GSDIFILRFVRLIRPLVGRQSEAKLWLTPHPVRDSNSFATLLSHCSAIFQMQSNTWRASELNGLRSKTRRGGWRRGEDLALRFPAVSPTEMPKHTQANHLPRLFEP